MANLRKYLGYLSLLEEKRFSPYEILLQEPIYSLSNKLYFLIWRR